MNAERLEKFPLLAALGDAGRREVADALETMDLPAGVWLFREGDRADAALFVVEGRVRVRSSRLGAAAEFGGGEVLGTLSLVLEGPREASAETLSRCRLGRLSRHAYERLAAASPGAACRLLEGILREYAGAVREDVRRGSPAAGPVDPIRSND